MESQQDIVDLTINDDDDCLFPTEPSETVNSLLKMDGMEGNKETAKQNHEDDTLSIYRSEDSEIATYKEEEKEEESKKIIFKRIWPNFGKKPRKAMFQSTAFNVYSCSHKTIYPGQMERFSLGFEMKMPKDTVPKYMKIGNDSQAWHSFGRWCFHNRPRFKRAHQYLSQKLTQMQPIRNQSH